MDKSEKTFLAVLLTLVVYAVIIMPFFHWVQQHWFLSIVIGVVLLCIIISVIILRSHRDTAPLTHSEKSAPIAVREIPTHNIVVKPTIVSKEKKVHIKPHLSKIITPKQDSRIQQLIDFIHEFKPEEVATEKELTKQLVVWLKGGIDQQEIKYGKQLSKSDVDIVVYGDIGLELKLGDNTAQLQRLLTQVRLYKKKYSNIITVILDDGKRKDLDFYKSQLETEDRVIVVLVKGAIKRKIPKKLGEYFLRR